MIRMVLVCSMILSVAMMTGCRMAAHPYDNCGPTYTGDGDDCQLCDTNLRVGPVVDNIPRLSDTSVDEVIYESEWEDAGSVDLAPTPEDFDTIRDNGPFEPEEPASQEPAADQPQPEMPTPGPVHPEPTTPDMDEELPRVSPPSPSARWQPSRLRHPLR